MRMPSAIRALQMGRLIVALLVTKEAANGALPIERIQERTIREVVYGVPHSRSLVPPRRTPVERVVRHEKTLDLWESRIRVKHVLTAHPEWARNVVIDPKRRAAIERYRQEAFGQNYANEPDEERITNLLVRVQRRNNVEEHADVKVLRTLAGHDAIRDYLRTVPTRNAADIEQIAKGFDPLTQARVVQTTRRVKLLRLFGHGAVQKGRWFICCVDYDRDISQTALPLDNSMQQLAAVTVPTGTEMLLGTVADQVDPGFRPTGGNAQIFIPQLTVPEAAWTEYRRVQEVHTSQVVNDAATRADLIVIHDDGALRFRPVEEDVHEHSGRLAPVSSAPASP
jgi:hypothetical protein